MLTQLSQPRHYEVGRTAVTCIYIYIKIKNKSIFWCSNILYPWKNYYMSIFFNFIYLRYDDACFQGISSIKNKTIKLN